MEEEGQKMLALKKAYAEIILNTAKEAAARVMASERKARRFQQDLCSTKDEAIRMLLHLKQMIHSKATESEMTSLSQRKRIEELEAQLNEAEDVIGDLRTELKQLWDALEKTKSNQVRGLDGRIMKEQESSHEKAALEPFILSPSSSILETATNSKMKNPPLDQIVSVNKCCNKVTDAGKVGVPLLDNYYGHNSDFASIVLRSKEPELSRNGFTQRIRAFERNFLPVKVPSSGDIGDQHSLKKNESISKVMDKEEGTCLLSSTSTNNIEMMRKSIVEKVKKKPVKKVRMSQRRKTRFWKAKASSRKSCTNPGQLMKFSLPSSVLSCRKAYSAEGALTLPPIKANKEVVKTVKNENGEKMENTDAIAPFRSLPDQLRKPCHLSSVLSRCRTSSCLESGNVNSDEDMLEVNETKSKVKPLTCLEPRLALCKYDADSRSGSADCTASIMAIDEPALAQIAVKDISLVEKSVLVEDEGYRAQNLIHLSSEVDVGKRNVQLTNSSFKDDEASDATNVSSSPADKNRLLRYTFQRKRKKVSFSSPDENTSTENSTIKKRAGEKQSVESEPQECSLVNGSSRDSRRLAQVARQLISLSGKRWW